MLHMLWQVFYRNVVRWGGKIAHAAQKGLCEHWDVDDYWDQNQTIWQRICSNLIRRSSDPFWLVWKNVTTNIRIRSSFFNNCSFFILVVFRYFSAICGELQCCSKKEPCSSSITLFGKLSGSSPFPTVCCQLLNVCQQKHYPSLPLLTHVSPRASLREHLLKQNVLITKGLSSGWGFS